VTPTVDDATNDAKHEDGASSSGEMSSPEPITATADTSVNGLVTSSPTKSSEDVADLEFKGKQYRRFSM